MLHRSKIMMSRPSSLRLRDSLDFESNLRDHLLALSPESRRRRFLVSMKDAAIENYLAASRAVAAIIAERPGEPVAVGIAEIHLLDGRPAAEFALSVSDDYQGHGIGASLVDAAAAWCRSRGVREIHLYFSNVNAPVAHLARRLGATYRQETGFAHSVAILAPSRDSAGSRNSAQPRRIIPGSGRAWFGSLTTITSEPA